jgi:uncharacterized damage-inducible protein DinB
MAGSKLLADRIRELFLDGRWIANTNYKDQLSSITREQAITKIGSLNSIADLTFHINYYLAGLIRVLEGGQLDIHDQFSFDLPPLETESDWQNLVSELFSNAAQFADLVEQMPDTDLDQPFVDAKYGTNLRNIEAIIEHGYYHLGQVSLIRKMM